MQCATERYGIRIVWLDNFSLLCICISVSGTRSGDSKELQMSELVATHIRVSTKRKHSVKLIQTLSLSPHVESVDMRYTEDRSAAILLVGLWNGEVCIYRAPLSHAQPIHFDVLKRFRAHSAEVHVIHMHPTKPVFVSASEDCLVKIWSVREATAPLLVKSIKHPGTVWSARYSSSGLLLTGCGEVGGVLRVYGMEPLCSLRWSCEFGAHTEFYSVAWSPSNHIAAVFGASRAYTVQVWDSDFHTLFQHKQNGVVWCDSALSFASDDVLISSGGKSKNLYLYNIPKSKATTYPCPDTVLAVTSLSSEIVCASCYDNMLRVYKVHGSQLQLLATLPHTACFSLASCLYPYKDTGYVLAFSDLCSHNIHISVTSRFSYWVEDVTKIVLSSEILPFCRDVINMFKYLCFNGTK